MSRISEVNAVLKDYDKTLKERKEFIEKLSEDDMRDILLDMCHAWAYKE